MLLKSEYFKLSICGHLKLFLTGDAYTPGESHRQRLQLLQRVQELALEVVGWQTRLSLGAGRSQLLESGVEGTGTAARFGLVDAV